MPIRRLLSVLVLLLVPFASGCASGPQIRVDMDARANMKAYRTFAFFNTVSTDGASYTSLLSSRLKAATRAQLETNGYLYSEAQPDLLVNFFLKVVGSKSSDRRAATMATVTATTGPGQAIPTSKPSTTRKAR